MYIVNVYAIEDCRWKGPIYGKFMLGRYSIDYDIIYIQTST